jgi:hypothetical protein
MLMHALTRARVLIALVVVGLGLTGCSPITSLQTEGS